MNLVGSHHRCVIHQGILPMCILLMFMFQPRLILLCFNGAVITMLIPHTSRRLREQQQHNRLESRIQYHTAEITYKPSVYIVKTQDLAE